MTYFFETFGCQMNYAESASVIQLLHARNWSEAENGKIADLVILNTCSVRITAESRALTRISHYCAQKNTRQVTVLVMGCMAERLRDELQKKYPKLDYVVGMFERETFDDIFAAIETGALWNPEDQNPGGELPENEYYFAPSSLEEGAFQSYVPIMNGCNNYCSYCIVPYVRGREVSRNMEEILNEFDILADKGVREVTLLGQNVNSYHWEDPETGARIGFPELMTAIARRVEKKNKIRWVRFMSSHPKDLSDELINIIAKEPVFCRSIHLPVQHGSNRILLEMNRKYTRESYLSLVERIRSRIPEVTLTTDILVGFPGETEEDLDEILSLMKEIQYNLAFMYHYNPREGTKAFSFPNRIPDEVKKERLARVISLQHAISAELQKKRVGDVVTVLIESTSRNNKKELFGHTELGEMVVFAETLDKALIGHFVQARLTGLRGRTFRAKIETDIVD
ncbi:MAG TPA: tRNA (N6-isopentenyl adenosine(37)-C2)-methylthiotransferase MiaB [Treponemataceae bacterium]|nr:tRNA (N6-isopentenyl adenosine(37)-C2)-methylthiotransferase MiaB [Treponemataceae bacterium]